MFAFRFFFLLPRRRQSKCLSVSEERQAELTLAPLLVLRHPVAGFAPGAGVGPLRVGAHAPEAEVALGALVHVWEKKREQRSVLKSADVIVADAVEVCRGEGTDFAPSHLRPSADAANPGLQPWQAKEPALLMQIPAGHTLPVAHSSTSGKKTRITFDMKPNSELHPTVSIVESWPDLHSPCRLPSLGSRGHRCICRRLPG